MSKSISSMFPTLNTISKQIDILETSNRASNIMSTIDSCNSLVKYFALL